MSEIPEDIRKIADGIVGDYLDLEDSRNSQLSRLVARAILAERERCAKVAETCDVHSLLWRDSIANAIRSNR